MTKNSRKSSAYSVTPRVFRIKFEWKLIFATSLRKYPEAKKNTPYNWSKHNHIVVHSGRWRNIIKGSKSRTNINYPMVNLSKASCIESSPAFRHRKINFVFNLFALDKHKVACMYKAFSPSALVSLVASPTREKRNKRHKKLPTMLCCRFIFLLLRKCQGNISEGKWENLNS